MMYSIRRMENHAVNIIIGIYFFFFFMISKSPGKVDRGRRAVYYNILFFNIFFLSPCSRVLRVPQDEIFVFNFLLSSSRALLYYIYLYIERRCHTITIWHILSFIFFFYPRK